MTREHAYRLRELLHKAAASLNDEDALDGIELFPAWAADTDYEAGKRLRYGTQLWRVRQAHRSQEAYPPSIYTASLYEIVERPGEGDTPSNPIRYAGNMALVSGKYYEQDKTVYRCFRDTINPVYAALRDLVGIYVEVYEPGVYGGEVVT